MKQIDLKKPNVLMILGGNLLSIIGCFLPVITAFGISVNYIDGDGKIIVVLCIISIALALLKPRFAFIPNILGLLIVLNVVIRTVDAFSFDMVGIGAWIIIIANIVAIIGSIKSKKA